MFSTTSVCSSTDSPDYGSCNEDFVVDHFVDLEGEAAEVSGHRISAIVGLHVGDLVAIRGCVVKGESVISGQDYFASSLCRRHKHMCFDTKVLKANRLWAR